jgi:hypothetical protein
MNARIALATAVLLAAAACSDSTTPPPPGVIALSLVTPNADDGAITLALTGPGITSIASGSAAYAVYWRVVSPTEARVIVVGDLSNGVMATAQVAEANRLSGYHVGILEVATRSDAVRASTAGYAITLAGSH